MNKSKNNGIATLPTIVLLGLITLAVIVSITSLAFNQLIISEGQVASQNALFYAEAGARDALTRIARNKNYECISIDCYDINYVLDGCANGTNCAKVSVSSGTGETGNPKIITSRGIRKSSIRKIEVLVTLDSGTSTPSLQNGEITSTIWNELTD